MSRADKNAKKEKEIREASEQSTETEGIEDEITNSEKELKEELEKLDDKLKRTMAEFDNFRKRTIKEKNSMYDDGIRATIEKILPVVDNLERAILMADNSTSQNDIVEIQEDGQSKGKICLDNSALHQGVEMTLRQFIEILSSIGVKEIEAKGKEFDPNMHLAVMHIEDEAYEANTVVDILQKGYIYKEKVIRYSSVKVAN